MANRFERLFQIPDNQYIEGSPVILSAGALLKDNETGSIIAQLKFQSVSEKRIKAVKVSLTAFDVSKAEVQGVSDYQYLELNIGNGQEFGGNKAIVMPVSVVRAFVVSSVVVVFHDGCIWESSEIFTALPPKSKLTTMLHQSELEKQYRLSTNDQAEFCPCEDKGLWQCACGVWNNSRVCTNCHINRDKAFSAMDISALTEQMNIRLEKEKVQREEEAARQAKLQEETAAKKAVLLKRIKIITMIAVIAALVIGVSVAIYTKINELTIEKLLALYTKEDVIDLLGDPDSTDTYDQYDIKFMGEEYYLLVSYKGDTLQSLSLDYSYPCMDDVETAMDLLDYKVTPKDRKAAKAVIDELLDTFTEKYGDPSIFNSQVNTTTYTWTINDRQIKVTDYTGNDDLACISAVEIDINCDHQSFCAHSDTKEETADATCTKDGYSRTTCIICGYVDETKHDALGHNETVKTLREPTCDIVGEKEFTCSTCGNQRQENIETIPHTYQETITQKATCIVEGIKNQTCSVCNHVTAEEPIAALGHDYKQATTKSAGCETSGTYTYTCNRCNDKYTETIAALGHSMTEATCTKDGACSRCGKKGNKAHGHSWNNNFKCTYCSSSQPANVNFSFDVPYTTDKDISINSASVISTSLFRSFDGTATVEVTVKISGYNSFYLGPASGTLTVYNSNGKYITSQTFIVMDEFTSFTETISFYVENDNSYTISFD